MDEELIEEITNWIKDFESQQPGNVQVDGDTFEGSAYYLLIRCKSELTKKGE